MKKNLFMCFFLILFISGCGSDGDRLTFNGEGENWRVIYTVDKTSLVNQDISGQIVYIGNEENAPKKIDYIIETPTETSQGIDVELTDGIANTGRSICENCGVMQDDTKISVTVSWLDKTENIELTK